MDLCQELSFSAMDTWESSCYQTHSTVLLQLHRTGTSSECGTKRGLRVSSASGRVRPGTSPLEYPLFLPQLCLSTVKSRVTAPLISEMEVVAYY